MNHGTHVVFLSWSPNGEYIASLDASKHLYIWETTTGTSRVYTGYENSGVWLPDNIHIILLSQNQIRRMNIQTGTVSTIHISGTGNVFYHVALSPDAKFLAASSLNGVQVINIFTGKPLKTFSRDVFDIKPVAWSPKHSRSLIASANCPPWNNGNKDIKVKVWDTESMNNPLCEFEGHKKGVTSIAWSPDGTFIASAGRDATVKIWTYPGF